MVAIFSNRNDYSTNFVCDWLIFYHKKFIRINSDIEKVGHDFSKGFYFEKKGNKYFMNNISSSWYRRGGDSFRKKKLFENDSLNFLFNMDNIKLSQYLYYLIGKKKVINKVFDGDRVNRLITIEKASKIGLCTPKMFFIDNNSDIEKIKLPLITKTITGSAMMFDDFNTYIIYTNFIENSVDLKFDTLSYFEERITKKYELRVFFLNDDFYSMAIFSQKDSKTEQDFRRYNKVLPNRKVPFKLPYNIEEKLKKLMTELDFNSGSIDLVVNDKNEYIFLEVNPIGQFGMVSFPCNYQLEKKIANYLA